MTEGPHAVEASDGSDHLATDPGVGPTQDEVLARRVAPVADALAGLDTLGESSLEEHVAVFERIHRGLQDALADVDAET
ncbi:MAG TPA: hypothetical protein VMI11_01670 [Actinomycetes bacterium]|nr:hypothetical protein [Actinomycetes bacterium]